MVTCPLCAADIDVDEDELDEGDVFNCDECAGAIRVVSTGPLEMTGDSDSALDPEDEDFEDEDEEEEDDDEAELEEEEDEEDDWG